MATSKKTSNVVEQQFPDFVRDEGPNLVAFVKAYYQWLEQSNNAIEVSKNLLNYQDLDNTYDKYFEYFHREIMSSLPRSVLTDKTKLSKQIKDLYRSKGDELSYRLLFRLLNNEEIDFYYPGEDILRASDGNWVKESSVRVGDPKTGTIANLVGFKITGVTSGATGYVDRIIGAVEFGIPIEELFLTSINGTFADGEVIRNSDSSITATIYNTSGPLQDITITDGGARHQVGDSITYTSASGSGATGRVLEVTDDNSVEFYVVDGGSGYALNSTVTVTGGSGTGAFWEVTSLNNTELIEIAEDIIEPMAPVVLNTGPTFVSLGANTTSVSANLASSNVSSYLNASFSYANVLTGSIATVTTTNFGTGYDASLPTTSVIYYPVAIQNISDGGGGIKGDNADIQSRYTTGSIVDASVINLGTSYRKGQDVTITNITRSAQNAVGLPTVSGIIEYPGGYTDTRGWLSWDKKLQDNFYYQEFSYEIQSTQFLKTYKKLVKNLIHPVGTELFARVNISSSINNLITVTSDVVVNTSQDIAETITSSESISATMITAAQDQSETITLSDSLTGLRIANDAISESVTAAETTDATYVTGQPEEDVTEPITAADVPDATYVSGTQGITESVTSTDTLVGTYVSASQGITESVTPTDAPEYVGVVEPVTAADSLSAIYTGVGAISESVTSADALTGSIYTFSGDYANVQFANSTIGAFSDVPAYYFSSYTSGDFDDTARLVLYHAPNGTNADGVGSLDVDFSVSGSIVINPITAPANTTVFTVGKIGSNSSLKLTTDYLPLTANAFLQTV